MSERMARRCGIRGVGLLRIAVMEVLYEAALSGECLGPAEIGKRASIFREAKWARKQGNDDIVWGVLSSLAKSGLVTKCAQTNGRGGWMLSEEAEAARREVEEAEHSWGGDKKLEELLRKRQWGLCIGCLGALGAKPHIDHIIPRSKGGPDTPGNKRLLCGTCNTGRNNRAFRAYLERLREIAKRSGGWPDFEPPDD